MKKYDDNELDLFLQINSELEILKLDKMLDNSKKIRNKEFKFLKKYLFVLFPMITMLVLEFFTNSLILSAISVFTISCGSIYVVIDYFRSFNDDILDKDFTKSKSKKIIKYDSENKDLDYILSLNNENDYLDAKFNSLKNYLREEYQDKLYGYNYQDLNNVDDDDIEYEDIHTKIVSFDKKNISNNSVLSNDEKGKIIYFDKSKTLTLLETKKLLFEKINGYNKYFKIKYSGFSSYELDKFFDFLYNLYEKHNLTDSYYEDLLYFIKKVYAKSLIYNIPININSFIYELDSLNNVVTNDEELYSYGKKLIKSAKFYNFDDFKKK